MQCQLHLGCRIHYQPVVIICRTNPLKVNIHLHWHIWEGHWVEFPQQSFKRANHLQGLSYYKVESCSKASFYCCRWLEDVESSYVPFKTKRPIQMLNRTAVAETKTGLFEGQTKSVLRLYTPPGLEIYCHNISGDISWKPVSVWRPLRWMSNHVEITRSAVEFHMDLLLSLLFHLLHWKLFCLNDQ